MDRLPGRRPVKEYPLTEADMRDLMKTGIIAGGSFSLATGLLGFVVNLSKDFAFSSNVPDKIASFWSGVWWSCIIAALCLLAISAWAVVSGNSRLKQIMDETVHEEP